MECRFCLDVGTLDNKFNPLIAPCQCKGSIKYVHKNCLNMWRRTDMRPDQDIQCPLCKTIYKLRYLTLVLFEVIPQYGGVQRLLFYPLLMMVVWNYWLLVLVLIKPDRADLYTNLVNGNNRICDNFIYSQTFIAGIYVSTYIYHLRNVHDIRRYIETGRKFICIPVANIAVFYLMHDHAIGASIIHHFLLPLYLIKHREILETMNGQLGS